MPFCPSCRSEYQDNTTRCAECEVDLVASLPAESTGEMINVFAGYDAQQVQRVLEVLRSAGVQPLLRDRSSSAFPTNVGTTAQKLVAVDVEDAERSRSLIEAAVQDGVIAPDGELL